MQIHVRANLPRCNTITLATTTTVQQQHIKHLNRINNMGRQRCSICNQLSHTSDECRFRLEITKVPTSAPAVQCHNTVTPTTAASAVQRRHTAYAVPATAAVTTAAPAVKRHYHAATAPAKASPPTTATAAKRRTQRAAAVHNQPPTTAKAGKWRTHRAAPLTKPPPTSRKRPPPAAASTYEAYLSEQRFAFIKRDSEEALRDYDPDAPLPQRFAR